ncbi:MAG: ABC transporter ATP-binding protein [Paludibacter sp.]|nr:ABC transporter ATP-binding protein [Paludibacter sp.]
MKITISNLCFGYEENKVVLNNVNLSCNDNHTIALVGASGCGKSTFLRLCCGILPSTKKQKISGTLLIDNKNPSDLVKKGQVGFMFQEPALLPNLSVKGNISVPFKLNGGNADEQVVNALLEKVELSEYASYLPSQLSGGMATRVALARTFIKKPKLLLLDEPFSGLDIKLKFSLYRELESLISEYKPMVIMVTHDINEALLLSNHIFVFGKNGTVLKELNINKPLPRVFQEDSLKELQEEYFKIQELIMKD